MMPAQQPNPKSTERLNQIQSMLRQEDTTSVAGSLGQALLGAGVLLVVGFILSGVITMTFFSFLNWWTGWWECFFVYLLILTPLLVWYERRSRSDYLSGVASAISSNPSSVGEHKLNQLTMGVGVVAELLFWGPRAVIDGTRGMRGLRSAGQRAAFERAALLVSDLANAHAGVEIKRLVHPPESMQIFGQAVDLLDKHGWIGKSSDGQSLWLNSTWREKLRKIVG